MYAQWERHDAASLEHQRGVALAYDAAGGVSQVRLPQAQLECARRCGRDGLLGRDSTRDSIRDSIRGRA